ncbi:hypothetical protein PHYC_01537 [Phycisphaerales bacterium]|nr:hypothetical protein PHYC_01537 [Phycisphaerales bacterium]
MTSKELLSALRAQPFMPFRLHFGSGRSVEVQHPEFVSVSPSGRTAVVYTSTSMDGDEFQVVDVLLVESIEILPRKRGAA